MFIDSMILWPFRNRWFTSEKKRRCFTANCQITGKLAILRGIPVDLIFRATHFGGQNWAIIHEFSDLRCRQTTSNRSLNGPKDMILLAHFKNQICRWLIGWETVCTTNPTRVSHQAPKVWDPVHDPSGRQGHLNDSVPWRRGIPRWIPNGAVLDGWTGPHLRKECMVQLRITVVIIGYQ